jgi:hypothetical protein
VPLPDSFAVVRAIRQNLRRHDVPRHRDSRRACSQETPRAVTLPSDWSAGTRTTELTKTRALRQRRASRSAR